MYGRCIPTRYFTFVRLKLPKVEQRQPVALFIQILRTRNQVF